MPKRSDRKEFFDRFTEGNPYKNKSAKDLYKSLRWGNSPDEFFEIEGPEDMASLGILAKLFFEDGSKLVYTEDEGPFLAVGKDSNLLYVVHKNNNDEPINIPDDGYEIIGKVKQTDYHSNKNNEEAYYYHKHEKPYPLCYAHESEGILILKPSRLKNGFPSYVVREEGIIG